MLACSSVVERCSVKAVVGGSSPSAPANFIAEVAQSVEQRFCEPWVGGSIPPLGTIFEKVTAQQRSGVEK